MLPRDSMSQQDADGEELIRAIRTLEVDVVERLLVEDRTLFCRAPAAAPVTRGCAHLPLLRSSPGKHL